MRCRSRPSNAAALAGKKEQEVLTRLTRAQHEFENLSESRVDVRKLLDLVAADPRATLSPQGLLQLEIRDFSPARVFDFIHTVLGQIRQ